MIKWIVIFLLLPLSLVASAQPLAKQEFLQIQETLQHMETAWNKGDLQTFMLGYENSNQVIYISKSGIVQGYPAITARYIKHYPNRASMGNLSMRVIDFYALSATDILVVGRWNLSRTVNHQSQQLGGVFSLVFRNTPQGWHIIVDHTC